ncbi:MAG: NUDIX domain-containing protein [bacterium]|nr:NUDIX domain-containing protein [bacterium]
MSTGLRVYVAVFLFRENRVLLLRRAKTKKFAPGRWTGVGGQVEVSELGNLEGAALREVAEETGLEANEIKDLQLRVVLTQPENGNVVNLVFFTGQTGREDVGPCSEGTLHWVALEKVAKLDMVENAGQVLDLVLGTKQAGVQFGVCDPGYREELTLASDFFHL